MNKNSRIDVFENYSLSKAFFTLAIPTVISQIIFLIYNYADTWYLGRIGDNSNIAVAALGICIPVYVILNGLANLFGVGGSSLIARSLGQKDFEKAKHTFAFSLWFGILASVIYALVLFVFHDKIIYLVGGDIYTYDTIYSYMMITMVAGAIPTLLNNLFGHLVRSVGAAKEASFGMSMGAVLNIFLDPIFMFVLMKGREVEAAALATVISNCIASIYFIIYVIRHKENIVLTLNPKDIRMNNSIAKEVIFVGIPAAVGTILAMVSNIFANKLINTPINTDALSGINIAKKCNMMAFNVLMGITQGMLPFVAYNYSSGNHKRMRGGIIYMLAVAFSFSMVMMVIYELVPTPLVKFFIPNDEKAIEYGVKFLKVIAVAVPFCALAYSINIIFQATGYKLYSFITSILRKGLLDIPAMFILKYKTSLGLMGVLWATPLAEVLSIGVCFFLLFLFGRSLKKSTLEDKLD